MAEPGPEPGRAWRVLALCGAAVFLAAAAAGAALLAWNLAAAASRGSRCPEPGPGPGANATAPPGDHAREVEELLHQLAEAVKREKALARQLDQAEGVRRELEEALRACEGRQVGGQDWMLGYPECGGRGPAHPYPHKCCTHPSMPWFLQLFNNNENSTIIPSNSFLQCQFTIF